MASWYRTPGDIDWDDPVDDGATDQFNNPVNAEPASDGSVKPPEPKMRPDYFVPDEPLFRAADAIANLTPCPVTGRITRDQVLMAFGEFGNIWPESIRADVIRASNEHAEKIAASTP